jgi:hypothetical protein
LSPLRPIADAFLDLVRPATIIGKIAGLRQVPLLSSLPLQTAEVLELERLHQRKLQTLTEALRPRPRL